MVRWNLFCVVLFGHNNVGSTNLENIYKKAYQTWPTAVLTFKKHQNVLTRTYRKSQFLLRLLLDEYTDSFPFFCEGWGSISKKLDKKGNFLKLLLVKPQGEVKKNTKIALGWDFFIFIFSLLAIMVTDTVFRKSIF